MTKIEGLKVIYFGDFMYSGNNESLEEEFDNDVHPKFQREGIEFCNVKCTENPDILDEKFDILLFDWGGASIGNSCMESFLREITKLAEDNPSRVFVMVSDMTEWAMVDMLKEESLDLPNVFASYKKFCNYWKGLHNVE